MPEFIKDSRQVYQSATLAGIPWLEHGFGTRHSTGWVSAKHEPVTLKQIHSDVVFTASEETGCLGEGDALVTDRPGVMLSVRTADCVPILIVDTKRRAVAAIHAGWRGTAASIVSKCVRRLGDEFGSLPDDLIVAVGPSIGECCYVVGNDVGEKFAEWIKPSSRIDLVAANIRQLELAGVAGSQVHFSGLCTFCNRQDFHSYRRDKGTGRMESAIAIRE